VVHPMPAVKFGMLGVRKEAEQLGGLVRTS
jgi:hypothetical protein